MRFLSKILVAVVCSFILVGCVNDELDLGELRTNYSLGDREAPVQIVEFGDFECEFCADFHQQILPELEKKYINSGQVRYQFKNFPIVTVHKNSFKAAIATYCAGDQNLYWKMMERLFAFQDQLAHEDLIAHAKAIDLPDRKMFESCLESGKYQAIIEEHMKEAANLGLQGVPTVYVNNKRVDGVANLQVFEDLIERQLDQLGQ